MARDFLPYNPDQQYLLLPDMREWVHGVEVAFHQILMGPSGRILRRGLELAAARDAVDTCLSEQSGHALLPDMDALLLKFHVDAGRAVGTV